MSVEHSLRSEDLTSLDERLGLLLPVRVGLALTVALLAAAAPGQLAARPGRATAAAAVYLVVAAGAEALARRRPRARLGLHRWLVPLDAAFLFWTVVPAGGTVRSAFLLFAVPVVAVTLLASVRSGVRVALWDTLVLAAARLPQVADHLDRLRPAVAGPAAGTVLAVATLWALALCAGWFASVTERELRTTKSELAALMAMAADLEPRHSSGEILDGLLTGLAAAFRFERAVAVWDDGGALQARRLDRGHDGEVSPVPVELAAGDLPDPGWADQAAVEAWSSRAPLAVRGLHPGADPVLGRLLPAARRVIVLPLGPDGDRRGVVALAFGDALLADRIPARMLTSLGQFSAHATLVLRTAQLSAEQARLARRDGLTGLANRRAFDDVLSDEVSRSRATGQSLSLVVLDIDHFKTVNDDRGHQAGDEVLREVGRLLAASVRASDTAARYGGEEFALVLPACGPDGARRVAEQARRAIASTPSLAGLSLSAGVATLPAHASDGDSLLRAADGALYRSKREGRDRVTVCEARVVDLTGPDPGYQPVRR